METNNPVEVEKEEIEVVEKISPSPVVSPTVTAKKKVIPKEERSRTQTITRTYPQESWLHGNWRPYIAITYIIICIFDFVIGPVYWSLLQAFLKTQQDQWHPLTLEGAGLFHLAMGAILGVSAWGKSFERSGKSVIRTDRGVNVKKDPA